MSLRRALFHPLTKAIRTAPIKSPGVGGKLARPCPLARSRALAVSAAAIFAPAWSSLAQPVQWSGNGHYYEFVPVTPGGGFGVRWDDARAGARARSHLGLAGYLVTITSGAENAFLAATFEFDSNRAAWTGGREPLNNGHWSWTDGPEAGVEYWDNNTHSSATYANWGGVEPNNFGSEENYMPLFLGPAFAGFPRGAWFDAPRTPPISSDPVYGFIVEYGGCICIVDYNCDGFVDGIDYDNFNNDFENPDPAQQMNADINGDGFVDGIDYDLFNNVFETGC